MSVNIILELVQTSSYAYPKSTDKTMQYQVAESLKILSLLWSPKPSAHANEMNYQKLVL